MNRLSVGGEPPSYTEGPDCRRAGSGRPDTIGDEVDGPSGCGADHGCLGDRGQHLRHPLPPTSDLTVRGERISPGTFGRGGLARRLLASQSGRAIW